jgi:CubicO group peptidase (beta-lactamase class C family)
MRSLWMLGSLALVAKAQKPTGCPILGPAYPAPTALSKDPLFLSTAEKLTAQLNEAIENGTLPSISIAVQVFSGEEDDAAYGFYHTDEVVKTGSVGVREVDEDTIFRIGSVSKLWTMFLYMTLKGTRYFHEPVAKYVPELRVKYDATQAANAIDYVPWSEVTIGELASHQAGIARDCMRDFDLMV